MKNNVFIRARRRGKLFYCWEGHNVWTNIGREYIAKLIGLTSHGPDVSPANDRIRNLGFGVGSVHGVTLIGAVGTAYPAGEDPYATAGNEYSHVYPVAPDIGTLERPVRFSGGTNPYDTAAGSDVWLTTPEMPKTFTYQADDYTTAIKTFIRGMDGDIAYGTFTEVPLTEAGIFLDTSNENEPFNPTAAYIDFEPLIITDEVEAEVTWLVGL